MSRLLTTYDPHAHVDPGCWFPRCAAASDGSLDGTPYCLAHADVVIERWAAVSLAPTAARLLPAISDS